jgi:hypothetical protein
VGLEPDKRLGRQVNSLLDVGGQLIDRRRPGRGLKGFEQFC